MEDFFSFQTLLFLKLLLGFNIKNQLLPYNIKNSFCNFPSGGPKKVGFPFVSVHYISKKFGFWLLLPLSYHILGATKSVRDAFLRRSKAFLTCLQGYVLYISIFSTVSNLSIRYEFKRLFNRSTGIYIIHLSFPQKIF